jgi:MFS family permease
MEGKMKLNYKKTFLLGLGFFAVSLVWPLYNIYVPIFLRDFMSKQIQINAIMTLDNVLAVSLIPFVAALSDRTKTRYGRRMPYLMVGIPIAALMFILLPSYTSLISLMVIITILNFSMAIFRAPTVALMPDITPPPLRSEANGIINFMGGLASVVVLIGGAILYEIYHTLPFLLTSLLMLLALLMLVKYIKEPLQFVAAKDNKSSIKEMLKAIPSHERRETGFILLAIFFWFVGYQGVEATFSNYCVQFLKLPVSSASLILGFFALAFLIFAIPAGFIGSKFGKKRTILVGIFGDAITFIALFSLGNFIPYRFSFMMVLMFLGGFFWALININSYPLVVSQAPESLVGTYTGLYYFASSAAAILGPLTLGAFIDLFSFAPMFLLTSLSYLIAGVFMIKFRDLPSQ